LALEAFAMRGDMRTTKSHCARTFSACVFLLAFSACASRQRVEVDLTSALLPQLPTDHRSLVLVPRGILDYAEPDRTSLEKEMGFHLSRASTIVVGQVTNSSGRLKSDGTWIVTAVSVRVDEMVNATAPLSADSPLVTFEHDGGALAIERWRLETANRPVFRVGQRYLIFLGGPPGSMPTLRAAWRIRDDDTLGGVGEQRERNPFFGGMKLRPVLEEVRRQLKQPEIGDRSGSLPRCVEVCLERTASEASHSDKQETISSPGKPRRGEPHMLLSRPLRLSLSCHAHETARGPFHEIGKQPLGRTMPYERR
jgi:hypothetical protein